MVCQEGEVSGLGSWFILAMFLRVLWGNKFIVRDGRKTGVLLFPQTAKIKTKRKYLTPRKTKAHTLGSEFEIP